MEQVLSLSALSLSLSALSLSLSLSLSLVASIGTLTMDLVQVISRMRTSGIGAILDYAAEVEPSHAVEYDPFTKSQLTRRN